MGGSAWAADLPCVFLITSICQIPWSCPGGDKQKALGSPNCSHSERSQRGAGPAGQELGECVMLALGSPHPFNLLCVHKSVVLSWPLLAPSPSPLLALCPLVISLLSPSLGCVPTSLASAFPSRFSTPSEMLCSIVHTFLNSP